MNFVDVLIILIVIIVAIRGYQVGFFREALSVGGFILGLFIATWLVEKSVPHLPATTLEPLFITIGTLIIVITIGLAIELVGHDLTRGVHWPSLDEVNRISGLLFGVVATLFSVWLIGIMLSHSTDLAFSQPVQRSVIIRDLDHVLSPSSPDFASIESLLARNGFPEAFAGLEPTVNTKVNLPSSVVVADAVVAAGSSSVKVQGVACSEEVLGSGFVAAPGIVVTNAHVVAGEVSPLVVDAVGTHLAEVIYFNPNLDLAILRVPGLSDPSLVIDPSAEPATTTGAILGYPGGGSLVSGPAAIITELTAIGRNIYGQALVTRSIYQLQANINPGNSGGPLVLPNGHVIGVVFARSTTNANIGYALTSSSIIKDVDKYEGNRATGLDRLLYQWLAPSS